MRKRRKKVLLTYTRPTRKRIFSPEDVIAFLDGAGVLFDPDSVGCGLDAGGNAFIRVDAAGLDTAGLASVLDGYRAAEDADRAQAAALLRTVVATILAKAPADRTLAERGILAVAALLRELIAETR